MGPPYEPLNRRFEYVRFYLAWVSTWNIRSM
jgi:hypothetical protein